MAVNDLNFLGQVERWVMQSQQRMEAVFKESTKRTVNIAQELIPVDTGFARASIRGSLESMPTIDPSARPVAGQEYHYNEGEITSVIASARMGDTIYIGWTASYVGFLEAGHSQKAPAGFVRLAALQWNTTVAAVSSELKGRVM